MTATVRGTNGTVRESFRTRFFLSAAVDYMDKPEKVKALDKFETRAQVGILVDYHLQPGGLWKNEIELFRKSDFEDFDFEDF